MAKEKQERPAKKSRRAVADVVVEVAKNEEKEAAPLPLAPCFMEDGLLTCPICLDLLYNAMNVAPCNHKFCAVCIYGWCEINDSCPQCRWKVSEVTRDPLMNQIIDQFVTAYPAEQRSLEQRNEWDEKELLHLETFRKQRDYPAYPDDDDEEDSYDSGSEADGENEGQEDSFNSYEDFEDDRDEEEGEDYSQMMDEARIVRLRREKDERERLAATLAAPPPAKKSRKNVRLAADARAAPAPVVPVVVAPVVRRRVGRPARQQVLVVDLDSPDEEEARDPSPPPVARQYQRRPRVVRS